MPEITQEYLKSILWYDPKTGVFHWRQREGVSHKVNARDKGRVAGTPQFGYQLIMIDGRQYRAHRLAFLYMKGRWPNGDIDHIDMDRSNNKWSNLREASRSQNFMNKLGYGKSGHKGVSWHKQSRMWRARVCVNGKVHQKVFHNIDDAISAREAMIAEHHGQFGRTDHKDD